MQVLLYNDLEVKKIPHFEKIRTALENDDLRSAEVKKIGDRLYRAKLDKSNRLLFALYRYQGTTYALILEWIAHHAYDRSRFLQGGAVIDEDKIPALNTLAEADSGSLIYLNTTQPTFNLLDKVISFDAYQQDIYKLLPPLIIIGSAGSGKTALTLEKMKYASGEILYLTRSPYLVHHARSIYYSLGYTNEAQEISFLSFDDYLASIQVPSGKEMPFRVFAQWFSRHKVSRGLKDPHQLFEEFKGVMTGPETGGAYLSREQYLSLGIKQSIVQPDERSEVYDLFSKYLQFMQENNYYDTNILSYEYLPLVEPRYDFIVVDEVQDLTNIQLQVILKALRDPRQFILCGDSNQIVHPNFFSWAKIKTLFYRQEGRETPTELIRILNTNYRNSSEVTAIANRILKIKAARFGSVDRESNYLIRSNEHHVGKVILLPEERPIVQELNQTTQKSTRFAVIVMHPEQKAQAKEYFATPLIFSIQEAKGLEYDNVILYNFTSAEAGRFHEISQAVNLQDLEGDDLRYSRAKDKSDKSLEIYKFHINALYVAITRAVKNLYWVESNPRQGLFDLLQLQVSKTSLNLESQPSSLEEWRNEARKLEMQGKDEQAEQIRSQILKLTPVPWPVLTIEAASQLYQQAIVQGNKKAKLQLFEYALVYQHQPYMQALAKANFNPALHPEKGLQILTLNYYMLYTAQHHHGILQQVDKYGVNFRNQFNQTPLMIASRFGHTTAIQHLIEAGARTELVNNAGFNALQIALEQASIDVDYARRKLVEVYERLVPDNMTVQTGGRLYQLDNHLMEFVMLNLMMVLLYQKIGGKISGGAALTSSDFIAGLAQFPETIIPERRKKRAYISSILSKNEVHREGKYNRCLFYRVKLGHYVINPQLCLRIEGDWHNLDDLLQQAYVDSITANR